MLLGSPWRHTLWIRTLIGLLSVKWGWRNGEYLRKVIHRGGVMWENLESQCMSNSPETEEQKSPIREILHTATVAKPSNHPLLNPRSRIVQEEDGLYWRADASGLKGTKSCELSGSCKPCCSAKERSKQCFSISATADIQTVIENALNEMDGLSVSKFTYLCG